ncbi:4-hydroxythreonine-4-phosphate dehydrogenase PdxA [Ferrovibrio sp. MS7]|uniref:4-hydroxythreonine-4-phosphate dehydrogenase PdxA n=1 Tax=Ferrovibrio plantarum TaxID=3119164 RepID=UPI003134DC6C
MTQLLSSADAVVNSAERLPLPLALTMGEPAGIGGEIALKAWALRNAAALPAFLLLDDPARLTALAKTLGLDVPVTAIARPAEALACFGTALPVLPLQLAAPVTPGQPADANAPMVIAAIEQAVRLTQAGETAAVVTNPIHKAALYGAGFKYPGHTEFVAALCDNADVAMMLASPQLRVVLVSIHVSLRQAIETLTTAGIVKIARIADAALRRDFGLAKPRLGIAGLNPHAGEAGSMGHEDATIVASAVAELRRLGIAAEGPMPPDTMFHAEARQGYDAAICMYHDQGLIPLKTLDFDRGVNVTIGLPIIRTSPDHGTAFDIAGKGIAKPDSLIAALQLAGEMARHRLRG